MRPMPSRRLVAAMVAAVVLAGGGLLDGCGRHAVISDQSEKAFLDSVYSQAPGIGGYRTGPQLISLGQAICGDLASGASVEELGDLGVVIAAAVGVMCPKFKKLLG